VLRQAIAGPTEPEVAAHVATCITAIGRYNEFRNTVSVYLCVNISNYASDIGVIYNQVRAKRQPDDKKQKASQCSPWRPQCVALLDQ
jgi:hypothetical protein